MVFVLLFPEVFELPSEHAPHHVLFHLVYFVALELFHHSLDLAEGNQSHQRILVLHQPHWFVDILV